MAMAAAKLRGAEPLGRLTRSAEFQELRRGKTYEGKFGRMRAVARQRSAAVPFALRVGLIVPGKLGNAPQRNRIKRRLREGMRRAWVQGCFDFENPGRDGAALGADIGIFASRSVLAMDFDTLVTQLCTGTNALMRKLAGRPI
jgi:ribonuclease P protein component